MRSYPEDDDVFEAFELCDSRAMSRLRAEQRREENRMRFRKNLSRARDFADRDYRVPTSRVR